MTRNWSWRIMINISIKTNIKTWNQKFIPQYNLLLFFPLPPLLKFTIRLVQQCAWLQWRFKQIINSNEASFIKTKICPWHKPKNVSVASGPSPRLDAQLLLPNFAASKCPSQRNPALTGWSKASPSTGSSGLSWVSLPLLVESATSISEFLHILFFCCFY